MHTLAMASGLHFAGPANKTEMSSEKGRYAIHLAALMISAFRESMYPERSIFTLCMH